MPRLFTPLVLGLLVALPARAIEVSSASDPWQAALMQDFAAAAEGLTGLHAANPSDARLTIAYASSLLVRQPRTETNIRNAREALLSLRAAGRASDEHAALALYLLARIELDHLAEPDLESARARLLQLRRDHPAHRMADHAAVELAYLAAYPAAGPNAGAIPEVEALLASVSSPGATRDLHALLASLQLRQRRDPAAALPHLVAARAIGYEQPLRNADNDLSIGNIARETGDMELARRHYAAFVAASPRDVRAATVRRLLAEIPATSVVAAPAVTP